MRSIISVLAMLLAVPAWTQPVRSMESTQRIQSEVQNSIRDQQQVEKAVDNASSDSDYDASRLDDDPDGYAHYMRLFVEPAFRLKGNNTGSGPGAEVGFLAAYDKNQPAIGFAVGYYATEDKFDSTRRVKMIPVMVRVGGNIPFNPGGASFSIWASGGYSINSYESTVDGVTSTLNNSYVLMGQAGFRFPVSNYLAISVLGGYQYLKPELQVTQNGVTTSSFMDMSAPFVKLNIEF